MHNPSFGTRIALAFSAFFKILFDGTYAGKIRRADEPATPLEHMEEDRDTVPHDITEVVTAQDTTPVATMAPVTVTQPMPNPMEIERRALQFLGALQREGRFIDFLMEDLNAAADADIGAAARVVHGGCKSVLDSYLSIEPVWPGEEGSRVSVDEGFDRNRISLTGHVAGEPPFNGVLQHPGWVASRVHFPNLSDTAEPSILMQAEIEL
jgi:hypothetical protein